MAYNEALAARIRRGLPPDSSITEKKMFGGIAFLFDGKMFIGVADNDLMVRVGPEAHAASLAKPNVRPMDFTGKPMVGYVFVGPKGTKTDDAVAAWSTQAREFVATVKKVKKKPAKPRPRPRKR
ncbi:MAG: TfoX/Sxy family protein [Kofleriaceae bacterium]